MLKAVDEDGNESDIASQLHIKIDAPFWKTIWFYSLLALAAGGLLYWLDRERMNRKEALQRVRSEIADNLHQEVNVALSNINILSEMANLKVNKEPQKSREYIEQIHNRSQNMMIAMDDMLWCIKPENDNMAKVVDRFTEHIDSLRNRYGIRINLQVDKKVEALKLDMKLRKNAFWLFKGGSSNVIRSGATDVNIHIGVQKQNLIYTLEFSNANLNSQQLNNLLQRQELADKLKEVNGVIQARLQGSRSTIELTIPV
jgi:signal transduction histidine kinase